MEDASMGIGIWTIFLTIILPSIGGGAIISYFGWLVFEYLRQKYVVSFNINTAQPSYQWIILWLKKYGPLEKMQHLTIETKPNRITWYSCGEVDEDKNEKLKKFEYSWHPRPLRNFFRHHKTRQWIMLDISKDETNRQTVWQEDKSGATEKEWETLTLWTLGTSNKIWVDLISEAKAEFSKTTEGKTVIYRYFKQGNLWKPHGGKPKDIRPWKTIVTQKSIKENILNDINEFKDSRQEYKTRGTPYRRGYLLHGPPGTGKSSLVYGLAGQLDVSLCVLTLSDKEMNDEDFLNRLAAVPKNSIVLLEDIDVALPSEKRKSELEVQRRRKEQQGQYNQYSGSLTMSGVLNGIDGVTTSDSQILIMTTNHKENLDPALIRPGRVDKDFLLENCNSSQAEEMFRNFFGDAKKSEVEAIDNFFQNLNAKTPVSPAVFENYLSQFKNSSKQAIDNIHVLEEMVESEYKRRYSGKTIVYRYSKDERKWLVFGKPRPKRPWTTIVTQGDTKERLLKDVQAFQQKENYYHEHGMPYRCGYLLHGPPGTGKSSLAYTLAGKLDYGICVVSFADKEMTDTDLMRQLASVPTKCIVLVEDIDVALPSHKRKQDIDAEQSKGKELVKPNLTLSGILNAIDGVESVESQIMIMTTNFKEHLDPALIRPGRVDKEFYLGNCNIDQAKRLYLNFFPTMADDNVEKMGELFRKIKIKNDVSPAALENYLSKFENNGQEAIEKMDDLERNVDSDTANQLEDKTTVYIYNNDERKWQMFGKPQPKRCWKAMILQNNIKENLINDIKSFQQNQELYRDHGIPFRRHYLFHGPHGTGKTQLAYSLAGKLNCSICPLNLSEKDLTVDSLMGRLRNIPHKCILLIENIDVSLPSAKRKNALKSKAEERIEEEVKNNLSVFDVCNAIDSFESDSSPILIMTARNKEDIASDILQSGRVDIDYHFGNCDVEQIKDMFCNFYPSLKQDEVNKLLQIFKQCSNKSFEEDPISPSEFQRHLFRFLTSASGALQNITLLKKYLHFPTDDNIILSDSECSDEK